MYHKPSKKKMLFRRIFVYIGMVLAVVVIVTSVVLFVLGYRFDADNGVIEQYALLQLESKPSGASISIDGKEISYQTPTKVSVKAGKHEVSMKKVGYATWSKIVDVKSGVLKWLDYVELVPAQLAVEPVQNFESLYATLASPEGRYIIAQSQSSLPAFDLIDLRSNPVKITKLTIPSSVYSEPTTVGLVHKFDVTKWDEGARYVLIKHTYGDKYEWLVLDTSTAKPTKNVTRLFDFAISSIDFSGTSGNIFYVLGQSDFRKVDLSAETMSRPLISNVLSFSTYNSNIISYIGKTTNVNEKIIGLYREGDDTPYVLKTIVASNDAPINVATARYFNEDYVAISDGKNVSIKKINYPGILNDASSIMVDYAVFSTTENIDNLSFSATGQYVFMKSGAYFASYDLEYQALSTSLVAGSGNSVTIKWLNDDCLWSERDGNLTIRDFDGANVHLINQVVDGQDASLTSDGTYLYSFSKATAGYQLQRVRMILP